MQWKTAWISTLLFTLRSKQWYSAKEYCTVMTLKSWFILLSHTHSTFYTQHPIINTETQHFTVATFKIWPTCFSHVKKNPLCWQCKMLSRDFDRVPFLQIVTVQSSGKQSFSLQCRRDGFGSIFFPLKQYIDTITEFSFEFYSRKLLINVKILGCGNYLIV